LTARAMIRPVMGDLVELRSRGRGSSKEGEVVGVASTKVHFLIKTTYLKRVRHRFVGLSGIERVISQEEK